MHNIVQKVQGTKLLLEVDLSPAALKAAQPSTTGKTLLLATSHGAHEVSVSGDLVHGALGSRTITFSLNVMVKRSA